MTRPPGIARLLMWMLLPRRLYEAVAGDLEELWQLHRDRREFWLLALRSILDARMPGTQPATHEGGDSIMQGLYQDIRYACRAMWRAPGFALTAILTLTIGIGANTAVFAILNVLALKPLSYRDPSTVAFVLGIDTSSGQMRFSLPIADYLDLRRDVPAFTDLAAYTYVSANVTGGQVPERVQAYRVTSNTFDLLGVPAALGRTLTSADAEPQSHPVIVISDGLWKRSFGADPSIVGRRLTIDGRPHEVIGVMPAGFEYPVFNFKGEAWLPWTIDEGAISVDRTAAGSGTIVARLAPGMDPTRARAQADTVMRRLADAHPDTHRTLGVRVVEMGRLDDEGAGPALALALGAVGLVLLLACANVANILLARGISRTRELAVRAAVGATRWRIVRQLLIESLMLALAGALGGAAAAGLALRALVASLPEMVRTTVPNIETLGIDPPVLFFTIGVTVFTTLAAGLLPSVRATRPSLQPGLREGQATGGSRGTRRLRNTLVVAEVTLATLLVIAAALLVRSHAALGRVDPGFNGRDVLTLAMTLPVDRYPDAPARARFYEALAEGVSSSPGVRAAGLVNVLPFSTYDRSTPFVLERGPIPDRGLEPRASLRIASSGYFDAMQIPRVAGRNFDARDHRDAEPIVIVNRAFVRRYMNEQNAVGERIRVGVAASQTPWARVVGIVGDVRHSQLTETPEPAIYVPLAQATGTGMMMLAVRTAGDPTSYIPAIRAEITRIDPMQPVYHVKPLMRLVDDSRLVNTTSAWLMGIFSVVALALALIGIYGVVSYSVSQQLPEFGLRLALGASPRSVTARVLRQGASLMGVGVVLGTAGAFLLSAALQTFMIGVSATDPMTYTVCAATLALLGGAACLGPAIRAAAADPLKSLRAD